MKTQLLLFVLVTSQINLTAQPAIQWQKCLGGSNNEWANSVQETDDGGYIVAGYTTSDNGDVSGYHGDDDCWVVKLDSGGSLLWQVCLGGSADERGNSIKQTSDGGYIVAGYTTSNNGQVSGNHGNEDCWVVKLDGSGVIQWQKCLGGSERDFANAIQQTNDGGYVMAGYTFSDNGDVSGNHGSDDYWVVKMDSTGNIQWQHCYGGTESDYANDIYQNNNGNYIVAGYTYSNNGDVSGNNGSYDSWVIALNGNGNLLWQSCLGGTSSEYTYSVGQTTGGNIVVAGSTGSNNGDVSGNHNTSGIGFEWDQWIVMLNNNGTLLWQKCLGGSDQDIAFSAQQTTDGGLVVGGNAWSTNGNVLGNHGSSDFWVVKLDVSGNIQWQKCLGGSSFEMSREIRQTSDGGFVLAGFTMSNNGDVSGHHGNYDFWVVKLLPVSAPLPVELVMFTGEAMEDHTLLKWSTATEINNDYFTVLKSVHNNNFEPIGRIPGSGNSSQQLNYSFRDEDPEKGMNYYQLRQTDYDGKSTLSEIIAVNTESVNEYRIIISPNPADDYIEVTFLNDVDEFEIEIAKPFGQTILKSNNQYNIDVSNLANGIYFIKVKSQDRIYSQMVAIH